ncbi:MAG: PEGA domain-containing protein [Polyangiaceae bacterium]|nr:PEGA domain-containing protein [Polyangiaceae bacterium]
MRPLRPKPRFEPVIRAALCAASIGALALAAPPALAADPDARPNPEDAALAEALFKEARELMRKKDYAAACPKFAESYRLDPALGAQLNLASCHELEGKIATAWGEFSDAAARALRAKDRTREKFAREKADALEPRLPKLVLLMPSPPKELLLSRDDATLRAASLGTPLPIDPGPHTVSAEAPGYKRWTKEIQVREGEVLRLEIPALTPEEKASPAGGPRPDGPRADAGPDAAGPSSGSSGRRIAGVVVGAVGLAGLAAGGVFVGLTASKKSSADDGGCDGDHVCTAEGIAEIEDARLFANVANLALGAGAALVITGGILYLTAGDAPPAAAASARAPRLSVAPAVGPGGAGAVARLRF